MVLELLLALSTLSGKPISLFVDATDSYRCLLRVTEKIPAPSSKFAPGKFAIHYPTWLPGNHRPSGPINDVIRFHAYVNGKEIPWTRDPVDLFEIDLQTPPDTQEVELKFVVAAQPGTTEGSQLGRLNWNRVVWLPSGHIDSIPVEASIKPPAGWNIFTALVPSSTTPSLTTYKPVNAEELVDSPAEMGANAKSFDLGDNHFFDVLTQQPDELDISPQIIQNAKNLVAETGKLFHGIRHYRQYHFLMTFAPVAGAGLEHHESSEDGSGEAALRDPNGSGIGELISHEMFHSWNGKHRRPAGLITPDFTVPEKTQLLWVYEGMTQYYGNVLACRSGFTTPEMTRNTMAREIGQMAIKPGHTWRPLADTSDAASILRGATNWSLDRRQQDYYSEAVGLWLEADCIIRSLTHNQRSLDDFVYDFEGGKGGLPTTIGYNLSEVEARLGKVAKYDWHSFFQTRVFQVRNDLAQSVSKSGWKLVFDSAGPTGGRSGELIYNLGVSVDSTGKISDLALDSPAEKFGLAIGDTIASVNGATYTTFGLTTALAKSVSNPSPIKLSLIRDGKTLNISMDYHEGMKALHLVRIDGTYDYLSDILKPRRG